MIDYDKSQLNDLVANKRKITDLTFGEISIGASLKCIVLVEITEIHIIEPREYKSSNFTFEERLEMLESGNGWVHLAGGLTCSILNGAIEDMRIRQLYLGECCNVTEDIIRKNYGEPDYVLEDSILWGFGAQVENYILVYKDKGLNFYFNPEDGCLQEIGTRELNIKEYSVRN